VSEVKLERVGVNEKAKGMLHWLSCEEALECEMRVYDILFEAYNPNELDDYITGLNPKSIEVFKKSLVHK
jgi:glutaminyl-tRNA synthetase